VSAIEGSMTEEQFRKEMKSTIGNLGHPEIAALLDARDGYAKLLTQLPATFSPAAITAETAQKVWDLSAFYYFTVGRLHEALALFEAYYDQLLEHEHETGVRTHKGGPLVRIADCHSRLGRTVLAKRYMMLTTCEDAIHDKGVVPAETTGTYFRLVWQYGLPDRELSRYAREMWQLCQAHPEPSRFPEWILQHVDQRWMVEYPTPNEAALYFVNRKYVRWLLNRLGGGDGKALELLAEYLVASMPGSRTYRRVLTGSTDYDVICALEGVDLDFRSELGRYFVCECKDWKTPADFSSFAKFCRVLDSAKCRFGILFSKSGISGMEKTKYAALEQIKVFQDRGMVIIVVSEDELEEVASGENFLAILRSKYEAVRLDIRSREHG
jgi:hypothetical protein